MLPKSGSIADLSARQTPGVASLSDSDSDSGNVNRSGNREQKPLRRAKSLLRTGLRWHSSARADALSAHAAIR
jgi:hypothetical protein